MTLDPRANIPQGIEKRFGAVFFMDVLGTRMISDEDKIQNFVTRFENLINYFDATNTAVNERIKFWSRGLQDISQPVWHMRAFSDTIILTFSVEASTKDLVSETNLIKWTGFTLPYFIAKGLEFNIPFRGCFSFGEFYQSERIMVGKTVYEAAQYHELPEWIGVSSAPSAQEMMDRIEKERGNVFEKYFVRYDLPTKRGMQDNVWCLAWPRKELFQSLFNPYVKQYADYIFPTIRDMMMKQFDDNRIDIAIKWQNTLEFFDYLH